MLRTRRGWTTLGLLLLLLLRLAIIIISTRTSVLLLSIEQKEEEEEESFDMGSLGIMGKTVAVFGIGTLAACLDCFGETCCVRSGLTTKWEGVGAKTRICDISDAQSHRSDWF